MQTNDKPMADVHLDKENTPTIHAPTKRSNQYSNMFRGDRWARIMSSVSHVFEEELEERGVEVFYTQAAYD